jgi:molecular chaperone HscB
MNYFELYGIPVQLSVAKDVLRKKYLELSRRYHPDYFIHDEGAVQQEALEQSAVVNKAFKTFSSTDETIKYVLELKGLLAEGEKYNLPPAFLMEMMELNEAVAEAGFDAGQKTAALQNVQQLEAALYQPVQAIIENYTEGETPEAALLQVKEYYFKKKYLERLKQQLGEML